MGLGAYESVPLQSKLRDDAFVHTTCHLEQSSFSRVPIHKSRTCKTTADHAPIMHHIQDKQVDVNQLTNLHALLNRSQGRTQDFLKGGGGENFPMYSGQ